MATMMRDGRLLFGPSVGAAAPLLWLLVVLLVYVCLGMIATTAAAALLLPPPHQQQQRQAIRVPAAVRKGNFLRRAATGASSAASTRAATAPSDADGGPRAAATTASAASAATASAARNDGYVRHWEELLQEEHRSAVEELRVRRATWPRRRLEATGTSLVSGVSAEPESELYGEKVVRITAAAAGTGFRRGGGNGNGDGDGRSWSLRDCYAQGDVLVMTPTSSAGQMMMGGVGGGASFQSRKRMRAAASRAVPREICVVDVGTDWLTASVGATWPAGLWECRKHAGYYQIRLDRTVPKATLLAQRKSLDLVRRGSAGDAARLLVETFYSRNATDAEFVASAIPPRLRRISSLDGAISEAIEAAKNDKSNSFEPNSSQEEAIGWALKRSIGLIRGPAGTGKTLCAALLISSALRLHPAAGEEDGDGEGSRRPRVLAVAHSNGAADVLLEALLEVGVPAIRFGRPASVSAKLRHRTVVALAERHDAVKRLRATASDLSLESHVRGEALREMGRCVTDVRRLISTTASVVVASCIGAHQLLDEGGASSTFPVVVLDEAAQTTEPALLCSLAAAKAEQVIFVGDTRQLPPTVASETKELRERLGLSPMARLESSGVAERTLRVQYRMAPALLQFPSCYFYNGLVTSADAILASSPSISPPEGFPWPNSQPIAFVTIGADLEELHDFGGKSNPSEAEQAVKIVLDLLSAKDVKAENIAIISPYSKQVQLIRTLLSSRNINDIRVGTVDSFQGQETDLVIFSSVRSNSLGEIGFLRDSRRLCVALTRAKRGLILLGDQKVLRTSKHWDALFESCLERGCVLDTKDIDTVESGESEQATDDNTQRDQNDAALLAALEESVNGDDDFHGLFDTTVDLAS